MASSFSFAASQDLLELQYYLTTGERLNRKNVAENATQQTQGVVKRPVCAAMIALEQMVGCMPGGQRERSPEAWQAGTGAIAPCLPCGESLSLIPPPRVDTQTHTCSYVLCTLLRSSFKTIDIMSKPSKDSEKVRTMKSPK